MLWRLWDPLTWLYYRGWPANTGPNGPIYAHADNRMTSPLFPSGAVGYYETSALTGAGVREAMDACLRAGLTRAGTSSSGRRRRRFVLPWKR